MATCAVMGQAIGTAGAVAARQRLLPGQIARDSVVLGQLQQTLLRDDQTILGCRNEDPADLARSARATASSEQPGCPAGSVTNGVSRAIGKETNQWRSQPLRDSEYVELAWPVPKQIGRVQLVFDTGFGRPLTLSHDDGYTQRMTRGPQPETVRDYEVQVRDGGGWQAVAKVTDNYQRRRVHTFQTVKTESLRIVVHRTNGDPSGRVFEIRAYAS
jgi:hypothetical protein